MEISPCGVHETPMRALRDTTAAPPDPAMCGARKTERPLAVLVRDRLGQRLADEKFAAAFATRGKPDWSPSRLAHDDLAAKNLAPGRHYADSGRRLPFRVSEPGP